MKKKSKLIYGIIGIVVILFIIIGVIVWYSSGKETRLAKSDNIIIQGKIRLANDKFTIGELNESKIALTTAKTSLENFIYNEKISANYRAELQNEYDVVNNKLIEVNKVIEVNDKLNQYTKDYTDFLKEEQNISKEYKYNPTVANYLAISGKYMDHCVDLTSKIKILQNKSTELYNNLSSLNTNFADNNEYISLLSKSTKSKELFDLMNKDYVNWCDTRQINQNISDLLNSYNNPTVTDTHLWCTLTNYYSDAKNLQNKRYNFLISSDFNKLRELILEKNYTFDTYLINITKSAVDYQTYLFNLTSLYCDYSTKVTTYNNLLSTINSKCSLQESSINSTDRQYILSNFKSVYEACYNTLNVKPECEDYKKNYPEDSKEVDCDYNSSLTKCDIYHNVYNIWNKEDTWYCSFSIYDNLKIE